MNESYGEDSHFQLGYPRGIGLVLGQPYPALDYHYRNDVLGLLFCESP